MKEYQGSNFLILKKGTLRPQEIKTFVSYRVRNTPRLLDSKSHAFNINLNSGFCLVLFGVDEVWI